MPTNKVFLLPTKTPAKGVFSFAALTKIFYLYGTYFKPVKMTSNPAYKIPIVFQINNFFGSQLKAKVP
ncbi:MAG: hypothetical protein DRR08_15850 [Candidatus Parabeggiatoa sp. nov. 2]|nr:MAG: hypothetical protein B6247_14420 [Beggiatoa sp. 4572_84]RKZ58675.1 MAG: hypothetical protein DRR08_15850 [Gammaproteobacteria bacterium]